MWPFNVMLPCCIYDAKSLANEALHIIIGITEDGNKEVLDYVLYPEELVENYYDMLEELKKR